MAPQNFGKKFDGPHMSEAPTNYRILAYESPLVLFMKFEIVFLYHVTLCQQHKFGTVNQLSN